MRSLIAFGVRQHVLMNLLYVGLVLASLVAMRDIPVDRYPNLPFGEAHCVVRYPGADASEVERLVTQKLEDALRGMESNSASWGSWASTTPPFSLMRWTPMAPSAPLPESTTAAALRP